MSGRRSDVPMARKLRPHLFLGQTTSLCDVCHRTVPAKIVAVGDDVFYEKRCSDHGVRVAKVSSDLDYWKWQRTFLKPGDVPLVFGARIRHGCPWDCGLCPDHEQHSCLAIVEVTEACDLSCPVCFAGSSPATMRHRDLATIERMLDTLVAAEGEPDVVQISGGEPTLHPQFFEILAAVRARPIRHVMINTNGVRIARDPAFVERLAAERVGLEVYLQFDSLRREALMDIRGADLRRIRREALEALEAAGISTTLVCVVKKGLNDDEMGEIIAHALEWRCVRGVSFQPVQDAGRNDGFDPEAHRVLLSDIRRRIVEDSGIFGPGDMIPLPCNPRAISIGYGLRDGARVVPVTSLVSHDDILAEVPNAVSFEKYPELKRRIFELFSLSTGSETIVERMAGLLCCLPTVPVPQGLTYANIFRVTVTEFLDAHNFCIGDVKRACVHFVTPEGGIVPFDTYNLFHRDGSIRTIRARLEREAASGEGGVR